MKKDKKYITEKNVSGTSADLMRNALSHAEKIKKAGGKKIKQAKIDKDKLDESIIFGNFAAQFVTDFSYDEALMQSMTSICAMAWNIAIEPEDKTTIFLELLAQRLGQGFPYLKEIKKLVADKKKNFDEHKFYIHDVKVTLGVDKYFFLAIEISENNDFD